MNPTEILLAIFYLVAVPIWVYSVHLENKKKKLQKELIQLYKDEIKDLENDRLTIVNRTITLLNLTNPSEKNISSLIKFYKGTTMEGVLTDAYMQAQIDKELNK